jgi:hypothetical protein
MLTIIHEPHFPQSGRCGWFMFSVAARTDHEGAGEWELGSVQVFRGLCVLNVVSLQNFDKRKKNTITE